jgi:hypothetical protein
MGGLLTSLWNGLTNLVGLVLPFFGQARTMWGFGPVVRWVLHVVLVVAIVVGLYFLNNALGIPILIRLPSEIIKKGWLPILFLLLYAFCWLAWWLWKLLVSEEPTTAFPDIDAAWAEAREALGNKGIDLTKVPLFLVLGRPKGSEAAMMRGAQLRLIVQEAPARNDAPLHVYANHEGMYVTCAGASLLGRQATLLAGADGEEGDGAQPSHQGDGDGDEGDPFQTQKLTDQQKLIVDLIRRAKEDGRELTEEEQQQIRIWGKLPARKLRSVLTDQDNADRLTARLEHLCRLIVRDRRPYCPVNGILVLVPFAGTDSDEDAKELATVCSRDLSAARRTFQVHCPAFTLVCDLETCPGFRTFLDSLPQGNRQRRVGQRFPLMPDLKGDLLLEAVDGSVQWVCHSFFPHWVYGLFRLESSARDDAAKIVAGNVQLYKLLSQLRDRQKPLSHILRHGLALDPKGPPLFGGCYFAGTGDGDAARDQVFLAGVFRRLIDSQNYVSWTEDALNQEVEQQRWTRWGYFLLGGFIALLLVGLGYYWFKGR